MIEYSKIEYIYYLLPIVGFIVGLFGTVLGGGGGFVFLPVLILMLGIPTQSAVVTTLVATLPIGMVGSVGHYRKQNIHLSVAGIFAIAGLVGAIIGVVITSHITSVQLRKGFGAYSALIAMNIFYTTYLQKKRVADDNSLKLTKTGRITRGSFFGMTAGIITGTFGTSGTAPIMAGLFSLRIPLKLVIGTSLLVVLTNTLFAIGAHLLVAKVDLTVVLFLTSGSVFGAFLGPRILSNLKTDHSEGKIKYVYAGIIFLIGILMIWG